MTKNADKTELDRVLDWIEARDYDLEMGEWIDLRHEAVPTEPNWQCNTVACLAGWTAIRDGWLPAPVLTDDGDEVPGDGSRVERNGVVLGTEDVARECLGLTQEQVDVLFYNPFGMGDLRALADLLRERPDADGDDLDEVLRQRRAEV